MLVVLLVALLPAAPARAATTIFVKANASGTNNGTSWANAYTSLITALSASVTGDQIWVAAGTYNPTSSADRTASFGLKSGVAVYGGFAGTETLLGQRNISANPTILSGDIGVPGDNADNTYHVVTSRNTDTTAILDGFIITGGNADWAGPDYDIGGEFYNYGGSPLLANIIFNAN